MSLVYFIIKTLCTNFSVPYKFSYVTFTIPVYTLDFDNLKSEKKKTKAKK